MSTVITLPEKDTLKSIAAKYLVEKIGFFVRPEEPIFDKKENLWRVKCKATITNYISNEDKDLKKFIYKFYNLGELTYIQKEDNSWELIGYPLKSEIEREIFNKYVDLTKEMEKELLSIGYCDWGKLSLVEYYLSPLYSMITNLLVKDHLTFADINSKKNYKFFKLLLNSGYLELEKETDDIFIESNILNKFKEDQYHMYEDLTIYQLTSNLVGLIFAKHYDVIKEEFGIRPPTSYVDTTKAYYFDAIRYGELIKIKADDILHSLRNLDALDIKYDPMNFQRSLSELTDTSLLNKSNGYYYGNEKVYDKLVEFRESFLDEEQHYV